MVTPVCPNIWHIRCFRCKIIIYKTFHLIPNALMTKRPLVLPWFTNTETKGESESHSHFSCSHFSVENEWILHKNILSSEWQTMLNIHNTYIYKVNNARGFYLCLWINLHFLFIFLACWCQSFLITNYKNAKNIQCQTRENVLQPFYGIVLWINECHLLQQAFGFKTKKQAKGKSFQYRIVHHEQVEYLFKTLLSNFERWECNGNFSFSEFFIRKKRLL